MKNPITMLTDAVGGWVDKQSPSSLGGIAFGLLTVGGLALIALGGHVDATSIVDEVPNSENKNEEETENSSAKRDENAVIDITDEAVVEE